MARRLLASYLLIIGLSTTLLLVLVYLLTINTFSRYLDAQTTAHYEMLPTMLGGYFVRQNSWEGVQPEIEQAALMIGVPITLVNDQGIIVAATDYTLIGSHIDDVNHLTTSSLPIFVGTEQVIGQIYLGQNQTSQRADEAFLQTIIRTFIGAGLTVAVFATILGILLSQSLNRPLAQISQAVSKVANGDYTVRVPIYKPEELTLLSHSFNQMATAIQDTERLRREFVANTSHDLRTPLTVIYGYLEGLITGQITDRQSAELAFGAMQLEVNQLLRLVDDLAEVAKLSSHLSTISRETIPVAVLVKNVILRVQPIAQKRQIELYYRVNGDVPDIRVDVQGFERVLLNLLNNAIQHTPPQGTVSLSASVESQQLQIRVEDSGAGIAAEHLPHVFERFYRADSARNHNEGGSGLGLAIVRGIVEAHDGQVSVTSTVGEGSCFIIHLPV